MARLDRPILLAFLAAVASTVVALPVRAGGYHGSLGHHGYGHHPGYSASYGYHGGGGDLLAGLIIGSLVGYLLTLPSRAPRYPAREYAYPTRRVAPPPVMVRSRPATIPACIQTREYQTTVVIDGRQAAAYGTRCLRPNGRWTYGPPKLVPRFD